MKYSNPIWPGGGGEVNLTLSPIVFFAITQKIFELGSSNRLAFLPNTSPRLRLKVGLYTYCLSPQTFCLNPLFYLHQTKSIIRPTSSYWIKNCIALWKAYHKRKQISQFFQRDFVQIFAHAPIKRI